MIVHVFLFQVSQGLYPCVVTLSASTDGTGADHTVSGGQLTANSFKAECKLSSLMLKCEVFSSIISLTAI